MLFGAAYYPEYQPTVRLEEDIRLMIEAGLTCVRLGESTWSNWEPTDGQFELAWMEPVLDALHEAGIKVLFGTPTYAIPPWLWRQHPEIMARSLRGQPAFYGARQNMDITHPIYRRYAERVIRTLVQHFAPHPAVIGFQLDNETGSGLLATEQTFRLFVQHLQHTYGTVDKLNEIWGLAYWSHRLSTWEDLWPPDGNTTPGYDLEWRRFQARLVTDFLAWQAAIVREYARPDQFITQDLVGNHGKDEANRDEITRILDIPAENAYHPVQDGLLLPPDEHPELTAPNWMGATQWGPWSLAQHGDFGRSAGRKNFLVTECNGLSIGGSSDNFPAYDGQWRLAAYTMISRGANAIFYWPWQTIHYGNETYWGGVLNHDREPGRFYREFQRIAHELQTHDALLTNLDVPASVGFLYSYDSKYALEFQPCLRIPGQTQGDRQSYQRIFDTLYRAFFEARAETAIVHSSRSFEAFPLLVVPALYSADDALLQRLVAYAEQGGHLLLTFRSGYADLFGRARWNKAPGLMRAAIGASYNEYANLLHPLTLQAEAGAAELTFTLPAEARAQAWADGLELEGATPLVSYVHPHFGRFPALVTQAVGRGRITYIGTLPNATFGKAIASWTLAQAGLSPLGNALPESVGLTRARTAQGQQLWFASNWSWETQRLTDLPFQGTDIFSDAQGKQDGELVLGAWDLRILLEDVAR